MVSNLSTRRATSDVRNSRVSVQRPVSLSDQLAKIFRHPLPIIICTILGALLGVGASLAQPNTYESTSTVIAYPLSVDPNAQATNQMTVNVDTEASVAGSKEVATLAAQNIDSADSNLASDLNNSVKITPHSDTAILDFVASADSPEKAAQYANATANAYLEVRKNSLEKAVESNVNRIKENLNSKENNDAQTKKVLGEKLAQAQSTSTNAGRVISEAKAPENSSNLDWWKYLLVGAVAGAIIGCAAAALMDSRKRNIAHDDRAVDIIGHDVFKIRSTHETEDAKRMLLALNLLPSTRTSDEEFGAAIYSATSGAADELASVLSSATQQSQFTNSSSLNSAEVAHQPVLVISEPGELAEAFAAAKSLGQCIVAITPQTAISDLKEIVDLARTADINIEYAYIQNL